MPLSRQQQVSLHQSGTIALPHPFPEVGTFQYEKSSPDVKYDVIEVCYTISATRCLRWMVRLDDVVAYCANPADPTNYDPSNWFIGEDARDQLKKATSGSKSPMTGSICVKEEAQVVLVAEAGTTAAESTQTFLLGGCKP